ncbi:hypothetical protein DV515_00000674 [Chloebia gouldiae]|uniref:Uncharacterized protein n=1 Tax=Chloebia gouldiae TaxID=44316 RepID=A0A3L8T0L7_CHLGU|nr:hypothetical protein DV515_00000674 [Chloebia gouldiae]
MGKQERDLGGTVLVPGSCPWQIYIAAGLRSAASLITTDLSECLAGPNAGRACRHSKGPGEAAARHHCSETLAPDTKCELLNHQDMISTFTSPKEKVKKSSKEC